MAGHDTKKKAHRRVPSVNEETMHFTNLNDNVSPLFKLPAEIRNRIYTLVLGTKTIHVNTRRDNNWLYVCQARQPDDDVFAAHASQGTATNYTDQHRGCDPFAEWDHAFVDGNAFALLLACRIIYNEAALVPLAANTFLFREERRLLPFAERLTAEERAAVQDMEFVTTEPGFPPRPDQIPLFRLEDYVGLHRLRVRMEFVLPEDEDGPAAAGNLQAWSKFFAGFANARLVDVKVMTYRMANRQTEQSTQDWAAQLERALLKKARVARGSATPDSASPIKKEPAASPSAASSSEATTIKEEPDASPSRSKEDVSEADTEFEQPIPTSPPSPPVPTSLIAFSSGSEQEDPSDSDSEDEPPLPITRSHACKSIELIAKDESEGSSDSDSVDEPPRRITRSRAHKSAEMISKDQSSGSSDPDSDDEPPRIPRWRLRKASDTAVQVEGEQRRYTRSKAKEAGDVKVWSKTLGDDVLG